MELRYSGIDGLANSMVLSPGMNLQKPSYNGSGLQTITIHQKLFRDLSKPPLLTNTKQNLRGHRCQRPQFFMIEEPIPSDQEDEPTPVEELQNLETFPEISLQAITGAMRPQTFYVTRVIKNWDVTVLIDGGSTHNFIDQALVKRLGLPMDGTSKLPIMMANGDCIECSGSCLGLTLIIQNCPVHSDFYVLPVVAIQVVLGVQWLGTLGPIETNYRKLTMKIKMKGIPCQYQGLRRAPISALEKEFPPCRSHDHAIPLLPNQNPAYYLGHIINHEGVSVDPAKIQAVLEWPTPSTQKQFRGFLGLAGSYKKFISSFGGIAAPLTKLLSKSDFQWLPKAKATFNCLNNPTSSTTARFLTTVCGGE
ncbi:hypothetical protein FEM48_Zijuj05G0191900 [Ziziphus jujuba var. spinosa]|uniref:Mitochondrial protein n=1 Tax=Ziziphus jujuba var. spinosa TaxID=714518 RepID=A0A978VGM3_ZIZJJ|nr:hypothetical protein FEM48_Zijuj05G0191900 [Ziziphus jujuba var. spinosa]